MFWVRVKHGLDKSRNMVNNESMFNIEYDSRIRTLIGGGGRRLSRSYLRFAGHVHVKIRAKAFQQAFAISGFAAPVLAILPKFPPLLNTRKQRRKK